MKQKCYNKILQWINLYTNMNFAEYSITIFKYVSKKKKEIVLK